MFLGWKTYFTFRKPSKGNSFNILFNIVAVSCSDLEQQSVLVQVFGLDWSKPDPSLVVSADETGLDSVKYLFLLHIFQIYKICKGGGLIINLHINVVYTVQYSQ